MGRRLETVFDAVYLLWILTVGAWMALKAGDSRVCMLFGCMALVLGLGDLCHLGPRIYELRTGRALSRVRGAGVLVTSLTATVYYLLLYYVCAAWYPGLPWDPGALLWGLAAARVLLCALPQNRWLGGGASTAWSGIRNIPFVLMGLVVALLYRQCALLYGPDALRWVALAVPLSFGCYLPVALFARKHPALGMLMMPKTLLYVWIQCMGIAAAG